MVTNFRVKRPVSSTARLGWSVWLAVSYVREREDISPSWPAEWLNALRVGRRGTKEPQEKRINRRVMYNIVKSIEIERQPSRAGPCHLRSGWQWQMAALRPSSNFLITLYVSSCAGVVRNLRFSGSAPTAWEFEAESYARTYIYNSMYAPPRFQDIRHTLLRLLCLVSHNPANVQATPGLNWTGPEYAPDDVPGIFPRFWLTIFLTRRRPD